MPTWMTDAEKARLLEILNNQQGAGYGPARSSATAARIWASVTSKSIFARKTSSPLAAISVATATHRSKTPVTCFGRLSLPQFRLLARWCLQPLQALRSTESP
jgi:hypothetical protein